VARLIAPVAPCLFDFLQHLVDCLGDVRRTVSDRGFKVSSDTAEFYHADPATASKLLPDNLSPVPPQENANRSISIAFFLHTLDVGGLQLTLLRLAMQLRRLGFQVCIVVQKPGGELASRVPKEIEIVSIDAPRTMFSVVPLARFLRKRRPQVLVSGLIHGNLAVVLAARMVGGIKTLLTEHAPPRSLIAAYGNWRFRVLPPLIRRLYPYADAVVAVSRGVREELLSMLPGGISVDLIYNPVVPDDVQKLAHADVTGAGATALATRFILGVGRLSPEKRFDVLIRAFAKVAADQSMNLLILGEGPEREALQALVAELKLQDRVKLLGYVSNPFPYMRAARALVVTSEFEGFCNVLVEAMACGTAVVSTDCPFGPHEILQGGRFGRLVRIGDVEATAEAIRATLNSEPQPNALIERAQAFSVESSADAYARLIHRLIPVTPEHAGGMIRDSVSGGSPTDQWMVESAAVSSTATVIETVEPAAPREAAAFDGKLKLAIYLPDLAGGGVERMRLGMMPVLAKRGADVTLLLHAKRGDLLPQLPPGTRVIGFETSRTLFDLIPLIRYLRRERPDVLLVSLDHNNVVALLAKALSFTRTRVVICQHNALSSEVQEHGGTYGLIPFFYRWLSPLAHGIVAVSRGVADDVARSCKIPRERITVIYNPVITDRFQQRLHESLEHPWLDDPSIPVFVCAGRLVPQKDHETLLKALAIYRRHSPARLILLGTGPLREPLEQQARELGITDAVEFAGFIENPLPYVKRSAAMILSSKFEGFGNVIVEALGCGTPVISTNCPFGPDEILDNGRYGHLVPVGDAEALAAAMGPDLRTTWPSSVLRERAQTFTVGSTVNQYLELFATASKRARS
jgi:glycosyltransferase involved in cell wall biosynthesis